MELITRENTKKIVTLSFRCSEDQSLALKELAMQHNTTVTDVLLQLIDMAVESNKTKVLHKNAE